MKVIVDTAVWSLVFRRQTANTKYREILKDLVADGRVALLAAVRQEVLSGIPHPKQFKRLKLLLRAFPDMALNFQDYELAADYYNLCRRNGIQGANTDFLICAASANHGYSILTTDRDFGRFATLLPIALCRHN